MCILLLGMDGCILQKRISREEAIKISEEFVVEQGFAHKKINLDSTKIRMDVIEYFLTKDQTINFRHNSLIPKAIYAEKHGLGKWLIGFDSTNGDTGYYAQDTTRRKVSAVIVSRNGKKIRMVHQDYLAEKSKLIE